MLPECPKVIGNHFFFFFQSFSILLHMAHDLHVFQSMVHNRWNEFYTIVRDCTCIKTDQRKVYFSSKSTFCYISFSQKHEIFFLVTFRIKWHKPNHMLKEHSLKAGGSQSVGPSATVFRARRFRNIDVGSPF